MTVRKKMEQPKVKDVSFVGNIIVTVKAVASCGGGKELQIKAKADEIARDLNPEYRVTFNGELIYGWAGDINRKELILDLNDTNQARELVMAEKFSMDFVTGIAPVVNLKIADTGGTVGLVLVKREPSKIGKTFYFSHIIPSGVVGPCTEVAKIAAKRFLEDSL